MFLLPYVLILMLYLFFYSSQFAEKRPEVCFLEYYAIPNITICPQFLRIQKLASAAKKAKLDHLNADPATAGNYRLYLFCLLFLDLIYFCLLGKDASSTSILPDNIVQSIRGLVANTTEPSNAALQAHIADLEQELKNEDFRLQYIFSQRSTTSSLLAAAKGQLEKMK